jgi:hypothetical protein
MSSQVITNKQILSVFKNNPNLCEINLEFPSSKHPLAPRHLCTCTKSEKSSGCTHVDKLSANVTSEHHEHKAKDSKSEKDEIQLFEYKPEEIKLYRKRRYQLTRTNDTDDENERDNTS